MNRHRPLKAFASRLAIVAMLLFVALGSGGCFTRLVRGSVSEREADDGTVIVAGISGSFASLESCEQDGMIECIYSFFHPETEQLEETTSTAEVESEVIDWDKVFLDPLIVQVPISASNFVATLNDGTNDLAVPISEVAQFLAQPGTTVTPETGHKFVILDLPQTVLDALVSGGPLPPAFFFNFEFQVPVLAPVDVKAMFAGEVEVGGQTYYPPMLPCTTSFANVPALTIPVGSPSDLNLQIFDAIQQGAATGCSGQVYEFGGAGTEAPAGRHYLLYRAKATGGSAPLPKGQEVALRTSLDDAVFGVTKAVGLGNPADKNGEDPGAPASPDHLVAYQVQTAPGQPKHVPRRGVRVTDQFGQLTVDTKKPDWLLVPATKSLEGPVDPPAAPGIDHFTCYGVEPSKGTPKLRKGIRAAVGDQFATRVLELKKPRRLCLPTDKAGEAPDAPGHSGHLMCYAVKLAKMYCDAAPYPSCKRDADCAGGAACVLAQPRPEAVSGVHVADQLARQVLQVRKPQDLCVPALVGE